jgi:hypothetical protein
VACEKKPYQKIGRKKERNFATVITKVHNVLVATIKENKKERNRGNNNKKKDISIVEV